MENPYNLISGILKITMAIALAIALILTIKNNGGIKQTIETAEQQLEEQRFYIPETNTGTGTIIVDRETGVCYYWRKFMNAGGLTVMVDADGKPIIWEKTYEEE